MAAAGLIQGKGVRHNNMCSSLLRVVMVACTASGMYGQTMAFEVASVRVSAGAAGSRRDSIQFDPGSLTMRNVTLKDAIRWAYGVMGYQVSGPDWLDSRRYDIAAKTPAPAAGEQIREMLQTLLAERFKLALHRETKELPAYTLSVSKNGPKFQESQTEGETAVRPDKRSMSLTVQRAPVSQLVEILSNVLHSPVIDLTGLKGRYDITVNATKYAADLTPKAPGDAPMDLAALIITGLQEEFGLKLEPRKVSLDLLIIEHAEQTPAQN
jgi:uncharacterized protein (TIGR03435 family)